MALVTSSVRLHRSVVFVVLARLDVEVKLFASDALVDGEHVPGRGLKVARRVVARSNVERLGSGVVRGLLEVADLHEHLEDGTQEGKSGLDLLFWIIGLHGG